MSASLKEVSWVSTVGEYLPQENMTIWFEAGSYIGTVSSHIIVVSYAFCIFVEGKGRLSDLFDSSSPKASGRHECGGSRLFVRPLDRQHIRVSQQPQLC